MPTQRRRLGDWGEKLARRHLEARGYRIVATNFRCQWGEIDIVAQEGPCLVFVEVRARRSPEHFGAPEETLSRQKRDRLVATAETYIQSTSPPPESWRIDLIAIHVESVGGNPRIEHIEYAVQLD